MRRVNSKQFAAALRVCCTGKKKHDIDGIVRSLVSAFGMTGRMKFLVRVQQALSELLDAEKGLVRAVVRVSQCDEKKAKAWTGAMAKQMKCDIDLSVVQDPSLLAGAVFTVGDKRYNGSVKARLQKLKEHLEL